ncbi:MAG: MFS transporter [Rhodobacteraceae bacterium]|nr:MFS transporter [Paracoccaceae bacterium]
MGDPETGAGPAAAGPARTRELAGAGLAVVALCFGMNMLARGLGESFAVFLLPVTEDLGWSRGAFSSVYAIYMISQGLAAPLAGALFDRFGARAVWIPSLMLFGAGLMIASVMDALWMAVVGPGIMVGIGVAGTGMAIGAGLIARWFRAELTLAMAGAYAGLSVGMITVAPAAALVIETEGWRMAYRIMGLALLAAGPILLIALPWARIGAGRWPARRRPGGLFPPLRILGERAFLGLFVALSMTAVCTWSVLLQLVAYLTELGYSPLAAATAYGVVGGLSIVGILATGWLADRFGRRPVLTASFAMSGLGVVVLWALSAAPGMALLVAFIAIFGCNMGSRGPVVTALVSRLYPDNVGAVFGMITIGLGLGSALGGFASGLLHDLTGGYGASFALAIAAAGLGLAPFWLVPSIGEDRRGALED